MAADRGWGGNPVRRLQCGLRCELWASHIALLIGARHDAARNDKSKPDRKTGTQSTNPPLAFHRRMYPPQADFIKPMTGGGVRAFTKGHVIEGRANGSIKITDLKGKVEFSKPGGL